MEKEAHPPSAPTHWLQRPMDAFVRPQDIFSLDLRSLAAARIGIGFLLCWRLSSQIASVDSLLTDGGILPVSLARRLLLEGQWSIHLLSGDVAFQLALLIGGLAAGIALVLGFHTRIACFISWALLLSLHTRNPLILNGGDIVLRLTLFWFLFLPIGERASLDGKRSGQHPGRNTVVSLACFALLLQLAYIYVFNGLLKTSPAWHQDGTAIGIALDIDNFGTPLGAWLTQFTAVIRMMTMTIPWIEVILPWFLFIPIRNGPIRTAVVGVFMAFHVFLFLSMELGIFPFICVAAWTAALPGWFWDHIPKGLSRGHNDKTISEASPAGKTTHYGTRIAIVLLLLLVTAWNLGTIIRSRDHIPRPVQWTARALGLDQQWKMFAPAPFTLDGWFVFEGITENEESIDVYRKGKTLQWKRPERVSVAYRNLRWRKYLGHLSSQRDGAYAQALAVYLCRDWKTGSPDTRSLKTVRVHFLQDRKGTEKLKKFTHRLLVMTPCP